MSALGRWARLAQGVVAIGAVVALAGCDTRAYCFDCESGEGGGTTSATSSAGGQGGGFAESSSTGNFTTGTGTGCDADLDTDPQNCGFCGNICELANAFPACEQGFCQIEGCAVGWLDLDNQPLNGCEYQCSPSANGVELCDGLDNDCNGQTDELFNKDTDALNCGACNNVCTFANAGAFCALGVCLLDECNVGFVDIDGDPANGCEYGCTETAGGMEVCDLVDNDCDADVDEGFDLLTDPIHCGDCGTDCSTLFPNTVPTCTAGLCTMGACKAGYYDIDGNQLNGCEYQCMPAMPGMEKCDGTDNDCDGLTDEGTMPGVGVACGATDVGECAFGTTACVMGAIVCQDEIVATVEYCDNLDNDCDAQIDDGCPAAGAMDVRLDVGTGSAVGQANSAQLAAAARGDTLLAAYLDRRAGNADIRANVSTNGGVAWLGATDLGVATTADPQVEPSVALGQTSGFIAFGQIVGGVRQIHVGRSPSPFTTWTTGRADLRPTGTDNFFPRLVVAKPLNSDVLVVVWQSLSGTNVSPQNDVYLQRSLDGGVTWLAADVRVNGVAGKADSPVLATDGVDAVYVGWRDARNGAPAAYFDVYKPSTGVLLGNKVLSANQPVQDLAIAAGAGTGNVHVAWTDLRATKRTIRVSSSTNFGVTVPADGVVVNPDSTFADAGKAAIAATAARVAVAWEDTRSGQPDIRVNVSINAGTTWQAITSRVDLGSPAGSKASLAPSIALAPNARVWVAWSDERSGARDLFVNHSFDGGLSFQPKDLRLDVGQTGAPSPAGAADSRSPFVLMNAAGSRANVVWLDARTSTGTQGLNADVYTNASQ